MLVRTPEITTNDIALFRMIWAYRGCTSDVLRQRIFDGRRYGYTRIATLQERGYIAKRAIYNREWPRGYCWYLLKKGLEVLADVEGWSLERLEIEIRRWEEWRNDSKVAQWNRLWIMNVAVACEKAGWGWIPKYEFVGWGRQEREQSRIGGILIWEEQKYALFVIEPQGGRLPIYRAKEESRRVRGVVDGVIVLSRNGWCMEQWGLPDYWEYVLPYDEGMAILSLGAGWEAAMRTAGGNTWKAEGSL